jgi:hypothetical protein
MTGPGAANSPPRLAGLYEQWLESQRQAPRSSVSLGEAKEEVRALLGFLKSELQQAGFGPVEPVYQLLAGSVAGVVSAIRPSRMAYEVLRDDQEKADAEARGSILDGIRGKPPKQAQKVVMSALEEPQVSRDDLRRSLRGAVEAIDQLIEALRPKPVEPVRVPWSEDTELLTEFQRVFELSYDEESGDFIRRRLEEIQNRLAYRHGIRVLRYEENADLFDLTEDPAPDAGAARTRVPAILGRSGFSKRGKATVPAPRTEVTE